MRGDIEMNFKDRGNKKWTAMMLIEHRDRLQKLKKHEDDNEKPILNDQEKEVINSKLQQALKNNLTVEIKHYDNKRFETATGRIDKVNINRKELFINENKIKFEDLLGIKLK